MHTEPLNHNRIKATPQNLFAEQALLGAFLIGNDPALVEAMDMVSERMFYREIHRTIYRAIAGLLDSGEQADLITVAGELQSEGQLEEVGSAAYLTALIEACPSTANAESYATLIKESFIRREILMASEAITRDAHEDGVAVDELLERSERRLMDVSRHQVSTDPSALAELVIDQKRRIIEAANAPRGATGTLSGFYDLDRMTNGFKPSELITLAGCSAMGKSALASQIAYNALKSSGQPVFVFSLEMSKEMWVDRMASSEARIDGHALRNGRMSEDEWRRLDDIHEQFSRLPMHIVDTPAITTHEIKAQVRRLTSQHGQPALIVIDYLQIAEPSERARDERIRVTQIVREFKNLARLSETPVLCLSQLSRELNKRENKRPVLSDLRETSAIEAESDVVLFVYRPSYYQKPTEEVARWGADIEEEYDEIIIGKQRNGPTGTVPVRFVSEFARFENLAVNP